MTRDDIKAEYRKHIEGAKSNRCVLGCGKRTSDQSGHHYDCYLVASNAGMAVTLRVVANLYREALDEWYQEQKQEQLEEVN